MNKDYTILRAAHNNNIFGSRQFLILPEKMTQGWVVYGGMRHAEPQREMFSRSYPIIHTGVSSSSGTVRIL